MSDPEEYYGDVCCNCKHCSYSGFPGAFACELKPMPDAFTEPLDTCDSFVGNEHWRPLRNLNEVMEALDVCGRDEPAKCPYFDSEHWKCCSKGCRPVMNDALYYLEQFTKKAQQAEQEPLSWADMHKMFGKELYYKSKSGDEDGTLILNELRVSRDGNRYVVEMTADNKQLKRLCFDVYEFFENWTGSKYGFRGIR